MKPAGWKRRSPHFYRQSQDVLHCIHFQASQWGTSHEGRFTINLNVTSPALYEAWIGKPLPANPATAAFPSACRIGKLLPQGLDQWWEVGEDTDIVCLSQQVCSILQGPAEEFFRRFPSLRSLALAIEAGTAWSATSKAQGSVMLAICDYLEGDRMNATRRLGEASQFHQGTPFAMTVQQIAHRLGLAISIGPSANSNKGNSNITSR